MSLEFWNYCPEDTPTDELDANDYKEEQGSGKTGSTGNTCQSSRLLQIKWSSMRGFFDDALGYSYLDTDNSIIRVLPDPHPFIDNFFATECNLEGIALNGRIPDYNFANYKYGRATLNYSRLPYDVLPDDEIETELDRYVQRVPSFAVEFMQIDNGASFRWVTRADHDIVRYVPNRVQALQTIDFIWHEVPAPIENPWHVPTEANILQCLGCVNSITFDGYEAQTVLFLGVEPKLEVPKLSTEGQYYWTITYKFAIRDNGSGRPGTTSFNKAGHNFVFDPKYNRWDLITSGDNAGKPPGLGFCVYPSADLNKLFEIP